MQRSWTWPFPPFPDIPLSRLPTGELYSEQDDIVAHSLLFWINSFMSQYATLETEARHILDLQQRHAGFTPDPRGAAIPAAFVENALSYGAAMREAGVQDDPLYPLFPEESLELEKKRLAFYRLY
jgi:hypothetical protein